MKSLIKSFGCKIFLLKRISELVFLIFANFCSFWSVFYSFGTHFLLIPLFLTYSLKRVEKFTLLYIIASVAENHLHKS